MASSEVCCVQYKLHLLVMIIIAFSICVRLSVCRGDIIASFVLLSVCLLSVVITSEGGTNSIDSNYLGLALVYCLQMCGFLQLTVRYAIETENGMTSVERLLSFQDIIQEKVIDNERSSDQTVIGTAMSKYLNGSKSGGESGGENASISFDPTTWPQRGAINITNLKMRYREGLELTLKGVNISIPAGAKVGVCGRTG